MLFLEAPFTSLGLELQRLQFPIRLVEKMYFAPPRKHSQPKEEGLAVLSLEISTKDSGRFLLSYICLESRDP